MRFFFSSGRAVLQQRLPVPRLRPALPVGFALGVLTLFSLLPAARAQVTFNLTPASVTYTPSSSAQTVLFYGTITNLGSSVIYLNDITISLDSSSSLFAVPNTDPFFDNVPQTLAASGSSGSSYSGQVFGINLTANASQSFFGNVQLRGGSTDSSLDPLATLQQFAGMSNISATPEPGTVALMAGGVIMPAAFGVVRRRRALTRKSA